MKEFEENTNDILPLYEIYKKDILRAKISFEKVPPDEYFYELCYCLLTPASKGLNAFNVVAKLKELNFFERDINPKQILREPVNYIRFHNTKSQRLLQAKRDWKEIEEIINSDLDVYEKRIKLFRKVNGFGMKESSHFLRNIGYKGIAVLDRHILKNLAKYGVIEKFNALSSVNKYLEYEARFIEFAEKLGIDPVELDLLFWAKETGFVLK